MTQHWKSALAGAAVLILSATAAAGSASAHELPGMGKTTAAAAPADRAGECSAHLSIRHDPQFGYVIRYGGSSFGWEPSGRLRITAVLMVDGNREGSVSGNRYGKNVDTPTGTDFRRSVRSATVSVRAYGPGGSVSCRESSRM